jgi:rhamnose transport system ATP-binding protein
VAMNTSAGSNDRDGTNTVTSVRASNLTKSFGGVRALNGANLTVERGVVHGLVGHNGAGKSTLVNILAGVHQPDSGRLSVLDKEDVVLSDPKSALRHGIGVLFQELSLWPELTVAENIWLETDASDGVFLIDRGRMREAAREALSRVGVPVDPSVRVSQLSFSDQQLVALARVLQLDAQVIILDEPTSALGPQEAIRLATLLRGLTAGGISVLFISHRLGEVSDICDIVTVFRDGKDIATMPMEESTHAKLVELMMGAVPGPNRKLLPRVDSSVGEPLLDAEEITHRGRTLIPRLAVRGGEIVGVLGLPGSGREGLLYSLAGDSNWGRIETLSVGGRRVRTKPWELHRRGVSLVPGDRAKEGLFPSLTVHENVIVGARGSRFRRDIPAERRETVSLARRLGIRFRDVRDPIGSLSGGNQQKVVLARALAAESKLLVMDEPTNGVDVGSRDDLHRIITEFASEGMGLVIGSSDPEELAQLCHRIVVMHAGEFVGEYAPPHDVSALMVAATGGRARAEGS